MDYKTLMQKIGGSYKAFFDEYEKAKKMYKPTDSVDAKVEPKPIINKEDIGGITDAYTRQSGNPKPQVTEDEGKLFYLILGLALGGYLIGN